MIQQSQEPIETTRDLASMTDLEIAQSVPVSIKLTNDRKFEIIKQACCQYYGVNWLEFNNTSRKREKVFMRQIIMSLAIDSTSLTLKKIAAKFAGGKEGSKDHTTVLHAKKAIADLIDTNKKIKDDYFMLMDIIHESFKEYR